jgi:molecular chaperone DnaK
MPGTIQTESDAARDNGNHEAADRLDNLLGDVQSLISESASLSSDDVTDDRFKLEDKRRKVAQALFELTSSKRLDAAKASYLEAKQEVANLVNEHGNDREKHTLREIVAAESTFIQSSNPERIEAVVSDLHTIRLQILSRMPGFLRGMFEHLVEKRTSMNDQVQAKQLIDNGRRLIDNESWDELRQVIGRLWDLMPDTDRKSDEMRSFTGIV